MGSILKSRGFSEKIELAHWGEDWPERRHFCISAPDGSILEITHANEYIRVVASDFAPKGKPFAIYRLVSDDYPMRPKTDFYLSRGLPTYMSRTEVTSLIALL
ncbi:hypothetical protein A3A39_00550 [Candidatus Kaiserbacteria bacterium RIFCSPLOWO2_01_FULL_54_13]|uniref:Uncharacterized protein n=1 Tax=Candidatus Kaiserbacteria bacterium RIFCSPLOWO2_01_FULL_54_13 TaxID=1798512 RepID=A0A1F6F0J7_9BACT|nr:MAG: hypothetical protein A3A39_00550 [Candidatus Kaiserbacteria bacterium RIFCSPLOWO2_01_FULL_54_13]